MSAPGERFAAKTKPEGDCIVWTASLTEGGYGQFFPGDGKRWRAHRWAWVQENGTIPEGFELDHLCRNRKCVRIDHLEVVTRRENQRRGDSPTGRNARKEACPAGHAYDSENTYRYTSGTGSKHRQCKTCNRERARARYHAKRKERPDG